MPLSGPLSSMPCGHSSTPMQLPPCHGQEVDEWGHLRPCMRYTAEVQCHRNSRRDRIHSRSRAALGNHQMQVSGRGWQCLWARRWKQQAPDLEENISMVLGIGAMRRSRVRGCCPTRQESDLGENFREERVGNMNYTSSQSASNAMGSLRVLATNPWLKLYREKIGSRGSGARR
jgi:hypothetical protein